MNAILLAAFGYAVATLASASAADDTAAMTATTASVTSATAADAAMSAELNAIINGQKCMTSAATPATTATASSTTTDLAGHGDGPWYEITAVIDPQRGILRGTMGITCYGLQRMVLRLRPRAGLLDDASLVVTDATILSSSHMPSVIVAMSALGDACTLSPWTTMMGGIGSCDVDWKLKLSTHGGTGGLDATSDAAGAILYHWYPELARRDAQGNWIPVTAATIPPDVALADATFALAVPVGWDVAGAFGTSGTISADRKYREYRWRNPLCRQNALAIGHFASATCAVGAGADAVTLQSFWLPGDEHGGRRVLAAAAQAVDRDAALLGPYPFHHLDLVEADVDEPGFAADGLILLPQRDYPKPLRPRQAAKDLPDDLITYTIYDIARLWWSGVIGTDAAKEPWLAEGLAGWSTIDGTATIIDTPTAATVLEDRLAEFQENTQDHDFPLDQDLAAYPGDRYAAMRDKGTLALVALEAQLGDAVFRAFIGDLAHDRYGAGLDGAHFRAALAKRIGTPAADAFYARWIHDGALDMAAFTGIPGAVRAAASASVPAPAPAQTPPGPADPATGATPMRR